MENAFENNILEPTSKLALAGFREGVDTSFITGKALSNGSAMRIAPIGCLFMPDRKQDLVDYAYEVSRVTHTSDVAIAGASMIAEGVSSAIQNNNFEDVIQDILEIEDYGYKKGIEAIRFVMGIHLSLHRDSPRASSLLTEACRPRKSRCSCL